MIGPWWPSSEEVRLWRDKSSRPASCSLKHLLVVVFVVFSVGGEGEILSQLQSGVKEWLQTGCSCLSVASVTGAFRVK